ncbi:MAG: hypothetical protein KAT53_07690 [Dehalococcoidia bacterium]|nr:hypothetical protein [Dehalococcoidia bacterium]
MPSISYSEIRGSKLLIMGDVSTGKTMMTKELLDEAIESDLGEVTVIDMAPRSFIVEGISFGGVLVELGDCDVRCLMSDEIRTPRLSAETSEELLELADQNREKIERLLDEFKADPSRILFINDVSIYLQCGKLERLWDTIQLAETVVANGYFGTRLEEDLGTGVSARERRLMDGLASRMDVVIDSSSLKN